MVLNPNAISGQGINFDPSKAVFIGDSLTVGLNNTNKLSSSGAMVLAQKSASTDQIRELVEDTDASRWAGKEVAYICAGTNNHLDYEDNFIKKYNKLIDAVYEKAGNNIKIYVLTMPPVQEKYDSSVSNEWIKKNNQSIQKIANSKGTPNHRYLECAPARW